MAGIGALAIGYLFSQFYRSFLAVLTPVLGVELGATKGDLSAASGAWFVAFALAQFGVGVALDRWGPRRTASVLLALGGGGGAFVFATAQSPFAVILAMTLIGIGCAPVLMAALVVYARRFSPARFAVLASWTVAFGTLGNVIGAAPLANAAEAFGWRPVMAGLGALTVLTAFAILVLLRDPEAPAHPSGGNAGFGGFLELMRMPVFWAILPMAALHYTPSAGIRGLWAGPYAAEVYGADVLEIGRITLFMALSMAAGAFLYGPLDVALNTRKWIVAAGSAISAVTLLLLALHPAPGIALSTVALMVLGVCGGGYGMIMAHGRAFVPAHLTGRGVTLLNFFSIGGVGVMQFGSGTLVSRWPADNPAGSYAALFAFFGGALLLALILYLFAQDAPPEHSAKPVSAA